MENSQNGLCMRIPLYSPRVEIGSLVGTRLRIRGLGIRKLGKNRDEI